MEVTIERLPVMRVAFVRHLGPYGESEPTWVKLLSWAGPKGFIGPETVFLGVCHDDPDTTPPDQIRYDACISVESNVTAEGEVGIQEVGGREYAVTLHRGPYEGLYQTYTYLYLTWPQTTGRTVDPTSPAIEFYLNDPKSTPPEKLMTRVCVPLPPQGA